MRKLLILFLLLTLSACSAPETTPTITSTPRVTAVKESTPPVSRFGTFIMPAVDNSGVTGTFVAVDNGDGSTSLTVQVSPAADFNPWGIFSIGDCVHGVPENTRPIFTLADIENGQKQETVETKPYQSAPGHLIVVVYGISPDGAQEMVACTELGSPLADASADLSTPEVDCTSEAGAAPRPDSGTWLAYSAAVNNNSDIYLLDVDSILQGREPVTKRLTTHPATDFDPAWSPDGTQIAFRSQRDGNDEIYITNVDGTCQTNLTNDPVGDWSPAWSPDGTQIAFARFFGDHQFTDIALLHVDGSGLKRLTTQGGEYPAWSPDGKKIAFASAREGNYDIYVMNADGTGQIQLTASPAYEMSPSWSPDGTQIIFDTQSDMYPPAETGIGPEFEVHMIGADGSNEIRLTNNTQEDRFPAWGPNKLIAFSSNGQLWIMNADGTNLVKLLDSGAFPDWKIIQP